MIKIIQVAYETHVYFNAVLTKNKRTLAVFYTSLKLYFLENRPVSRSA